MRLSTTRPRRRVSHGVRSLLILWVLVSVALIAGVPGCTIKTSDDDDEPTPEGDVPTYACGTSLDGTVAASPDVTAATGVARYDYVLDSVAQSITLSLFDEGGGRLGEVVLRFDYDFGEHAAFFTDVVHQRDGAELARQQTRMQIVEGELATFTRHEAAGKEAALWATLVRTADNQSATAFSLDRLMIGVPAESGDAGPVLRTGDGAYRVATVLTDGGALDQAAATSFIEETGAADVSSNADFQRMVQTAEDPAWTDHATVALRRCAASAIDGEEASLLAAQGLSAMATGQVQQAQGCADQGNPFADVLQVDGVLGAIATGETITGLLIGAGVVSGGWAILGALVVTSVGSYVILGGFESLVQDQAKKLPGIRDLVNLGNDSGGGGSSGGGSSGSGSGNRGAGTRGDPHLLTFDGLDYDFQGAGEFVLFEALSGDAPTVQVRQEPASGICSSVALNTAAATQIGGVRVHLDTDPERAVLLDGESVDIDGATLLLADGDSIRRDRRTVVLSWATGERVTIRGIGNERALDLDVELPTARRGQVRGLLGNYDDDRGNDLTSRDGVVVPDGSTWEEVMTFGASYLVHPSESLFTYGPGQSTDGFAIEGFPSGPISLDDLPDTVREDAEQTCVDSGVEDPAALSNCILDVGCTGDPAFADSHVGVRIDQTLGVSVPIDFGGWIPEGAGNWEIAEDGRSVFQKVNGDPTFFLSPEDYLNVRITGTFQVEAGDDDYIGFVIGYQSPFTDASDEPNDLVTQLLSWKSRDQGSYGGTAFEGFTLSRATGVVDALKEVLWHHEEQPNYKVLATDYGDGLGWEDYVTYTFELVYTESLIEVSIDGGLVFSVSSAEAGAPFEAGSFGFYNYSQPNVRYADFEVAPVVGP